MRSLQRALLGFSNLWIHFFRQFNWVSMSKIPSPPLQMEGWASCLGGRIFISFQRKSYILSIFFLIYFEIVHIWLMYHSLDRRIWFMIIFLPLKESLTLFQLWAFFYFNFTYFVPIGVIEDRVAKINSKRFNGKLRQFHFSWLISSVFICSIS